MSNEPLSPLLLSHFPYLSLYTPFITAFPTTISSMINLITPPSATRPNPQYNEVFATFLASQEADPRCRKLKLRDWLLTIIQRCPRYLLLLKDLIDCTDSNDPEWGQLRAVHLLVAKSKSCFPYNIGLTANSHPISQRITPHTLPNPRSPSRSTHGPKPPVPAHSPRKNPVKAWSINPSRAKRTTPRTRILPLLRLPTLASQ